MSEKTQNTTFLQEETRSRVWLLPLTHRLGHTECRAPEPRRSDYTGITLMKGGAAQRVTPYSTFPVAALNVLANHSDFKRIQVFFLRQQKMSD